MDLLLTIAAVSWLIAAILYFIVLIKCFFNRTEKSILFLLILNVIILAGSIIIRSWFGTVLWTLCLVVNSMTYMNERKINKFIKRNFYYGKETSQDKERND